MTSRVGVAVVAAVMLVVTHLAGQRPDSATPQPAAISGLVIDALSGQPLGDAVVALSIGDFEQPRRQQADATGRFVYPELRGGVTYVLKASRTGYLSSDDVPPGQGGAAARVALAAGQWARDVRVSLWPPASISGAVTDAHGEPVVGAYVRVLKKTDVGGHARLAAGPIVTTDDLGRFRIAGLTKGAYVVALVSVSESSPIGATLGALNNLTAQLASAQAAPPPVVGTRVGGDGGAVLLLGRHQTEVGDGRVHTGQYFSGVTNAAAAAPVVVTYGEERRGVDFILQPVPAFRVSGVVRAPAGDVTTLSLRLIPEGSEGLGVGSETATTRPGPDGRFSFLAVPSGRYVLMTGPMGEFALDTGLNRTRLPGGQGVVGSNRVTAASEPLLFLRSMSTQGSAWGRRAVVVGGGAVEGVDVDLSRGASITGQIVLEPGSDPPVNRIGAVVVEPSLDNDWLMSSDFAVTEPAGAATSWSVPRHFEVRGLTPGRYYLRSNTTTTAIKSIVVDGRDLLNEPIDVSTGDDLGDVTITVTTRVATLSGSVQAPAGASPADAIVICFPVDPASRQTFGFNPTRTRSVIADSLGAFRVEGLLAGDYFVVAVPPSQRDGWRDPQFLEAASRVASRVRLDWGATVTQLIRLDTVRAR